MEDVIRRVRAHNTNCPVCCTPYDIESHHIYNVRLLGIFAREIIASYSVTIFFMTCTLWVYMHDQTTCNAGVMHTTCFTLVAFGIVTMLFLCLALSFHMSNDSLCCVQRVKRLVHISLNVPSVQHL
jgi:hypothetical protein